MIYLSRWFYCCNLCDTTRHFREIPTSVKHKSDATIMANNPNESFYLLTWCTTLNSFGWWNGVVSSEGMKTKIQHTSVRTEMCSYIFVKDVILASIVWGAKAHNVNRQSACEAAWRVRINQSSTRHCDKFKQRHLDFSWFNRFFSSAALLLVLERPLLPLPPAVCRRYNKVNKMERNMCFIAVLNP